MSKLTKEMEDKAEINKSALLSYIHTAPKGYGLYIYCWVIDDQIKYVGASKNIRKRESEHIRSAVKLSKGYESKSRCQLELYTLMINSKSLELRILEAVEHEADLIPKERYWIKKLKKELGTLITYNTWSSGLIRGCEHYETHDIRRVGFRKYCKDNDYEFEDFIEVWNGSMVGRDKKFNYFYKKGLTDTESISIIGNGIAYDKVVRNKNFTYFETHPSQRCNFKVYCKQRGLVFEEFAEVFSHKSEKCGSKYFYYIYKHKEVACEHNQ